MLSERTTAHATDSLLTAPSPLHALTRFPCSVTTFPYMDKSCLSTSSNDREDGVIDLDDDNRIDVHMADNSFHIFVSDPLGGDTFHDNRLSPSSVIDSEPPGLGSCLSTLIGIELDNGNGINEVPSEPPGLGSRLSTSIVINLVDDDGIDELPSKPTRLDSRLSTRVDNSVIDLDEDNGIDVLIADDPIRLFDLDDDRLIIPVGFHDDCSPQVVIVLVVTLRYHPNHEICF